MAGSSGHWGKRSADEIEHRRNLNASRLQLPTMRGPRARTLAIVGVKQDERKRVATNSAVRGPDA
jgi:hypothetical protein